MDWTSPAPRGGGCPDPRSAPGRPRNCLACKPKPSRGWPTSTAGGGAARRLRPLPPRELEAWLTEPAPAPHGGESIVDLIDGLRGGWTSLTADPLRTVAVTHPAVIRAAILVALDIAPKSFWRIDIAPVSRTVMHFRGGRVDAALVSAQRGAISANACLAICSIQPVTVGP